MNKIGKIIIIIALVVAVAVAVIVRQNKSGQSTTILNSKVDARQLPAEYRPENITAKGLPVLIDVGAGTCIPCKLMAPILQELKKEFEGRLIVQFINLDEFPNAGKIYGIKLMPTQIFYDVSGKELFRHEGFYSREDILSKWKELSVDFSGPTGSLLSFERLVPAKVDDRPKEKICYMCDGDINPQTLVIVQTEKGPVQMCSPHCYFIMYSCLTEDKTDFEKKVTVADWASGESVPAMEAVYVYGINSKTGRAIIKAFAGKKSATSEQASDGSIIGWQILQAKELATRCGFCDRAVYPEDAALVKVDGLYTWGCCSHCAMGVAARTGKDIEVHEKDRLTGEQIIVKTLNGQVALLEPATAVAWFGQRQKPDGTWASAGCFHQGFFVNAENLQKWIEQNPYETGRLISISRALADKINLSPEQIQRACKIGECVPK